VAGLDLGLRGGDFRVQFGAEPGELLVRDDVLGGLVGVLEEPRLQGSDGGAELARSIGVAGGQLVESVGLLGPALG
jgi:hypothetical protein